METHVRDVHVRACVQSGLMHAQRCVESQEGAHCVADAWLLYLSSYTPFQRQAPTSSFDILGGGSPRLRGGGRVW